MAFCYTVQGERGSGKGAFALGEMKKLLERGNKVATNMNLFIEHLVDESNSIPVIRFPDIPSGDHFYQLGKAYDFDPDKPETIDPSKEGAIFLDEALLSLGSKKDKEFKDREKYLVLSRKLGWNIYIFCQHKDQLDETIFKSLTNKLIICRDESLFTGFFGSLLKTLNLPFISPSNHKAYVFKGRSELNDIEQEIPYDYKPIKDAYSTAQLFDEQKEYLNGDFVDMRSVFSYLPASYLSGRHYIDSLQQKIDSINNIYKGNNTMAIRKSSGMDTGSKIKIGLLLAAAGAYFYFSNPMDNKFIQQAVGSEPEPVQQINQPVQQQFFTPIATPEKQQPVKKWKYDDPIHWMMSEYKPRLAAMLTSPAYGVTVQIDFYDKSNKIVQRFRNDDFLHFGYVLIPSGQDAVIIQGENFKKRVNSWPLVQQQQPKPIQPIEAETISF
jgi:hypothetical protein